MGGVLKRFWRIVRQNWLVGQVRSLLPNWVVNTSWHWPIAYLAAIWYGFPARELTLIGVTGTDGKTTTVYLINHILKTVGKKTAMISSVAAEIDGKQTDTGFHVTSPHPFEVQKYLRQAVEQGATHAVLEVTSHALDQHRFAGCSFDYGVITNIRPDHLDYHGSYETYLQSKVKLLKRAKTKILNKDNENYVEILHAIAGSFSTDKNIISYGVEEGDLTLKTIKLEKQSKRLPGKYNLSNILAAAAVVRSLSLIKRQGFYKAMQTFPGVPGRFEEVKTDKWFRVIIDFAHTPYALQEFLQTVRAQMQNRGKLITVFGCAAERGKERRKMGKVSAELADITIITAEDPRFEGVDKISSEIAEWAKLGGAKEVELNFQFPISNIKGDHYFVRIPDRQDAVNFAIRTADEGDIVALCGKGHEKSMNFAGIEYPWDEREAVFRALKLNYKPQAPIRPELMAEGKFQTNSKHQ